MSNENNKRRPRVWIGDYEIKGVKSVDTKPIDMIGKEIELPAFQLDGPIDLPSTTHVTFNVYCPLEQEQRPIVSPMRSKAARAAFPHAWTDYEHAKACRLAYDDGEFEDFGIYAIGRTVEGDPPRIVFVGTKNIVDWMFNARIRMAESRVLGKMHGGYLDLWRRILPTFQMAIERINPDFEPMYLTGHSLGGALATCAAAQLRESVLGISVDLVTFGAPRVFGWHGANDQRTRGRHYVYRNDPVPRVPRWLPWRRYADPVKRMCLDRPEGMRLVADLTNSWQRLPFIGDHAIQRYEAALKAREHQ